MQALQRLVLESNQESVKATQRSLQEAVQKIEQKVEQRRSSFLTDITSASVEYVQQNEALAVVVRQLQKHRGLVNKYTLGGLALIALILWNYRSIIHQRTSQGMAELASSTLEEETLRQSIRQTLDAVATSPETLATLLNLLQTLVRDPSTVNELVRLVVHVVSETPEVQAALFELLQVMFQNATLQQLAGEFLLKGLDIDSVRKMLEDQTAALVRQTVLDESVQRATAAGVQKSLWYAVTPSALINKKEKSEAKKKVLENKEKNSR